MSFLGCMAVVSRKDVLAAIDATAYAHPGSEAWVAVKYVKKDGSIGEYIVQKSKSKRPKSRSKTATTNYMVRNRGLIRVIDQQQHPKSLFIFAIVGFNPVGDTSQFHQVNHEC